MTLGRCFRCRMNWPGTLQVGRVIGTGACAPTRWFRDDGHLWTTEPLPCVDVPHGALNWDVGFMPRTRRVCDRSLVLRSLVVDRGMP